MRDQICWCGMVSCLFPFLQLAAWAYPWLTKNRVLESIKAGKRLPEARFSNLKIASRGQGSVYGLCSKDTT
jgi:hypothetical protein